MQRDPGLGDVSRLLATRLAEASRRLTGLRSPREIEVFERRLYIWPHEVSIEDFGGRRPYAAFNPGAVLRGGVVEVYPRLVTGYYWYTSVIGWFEARLEDLVEGRLEKPVSARVVVSPRGSGDLAGCEDARVVAEDGRRYVLYTALEPMRNRVHALNVVARQALAVLDPGYKVAWSTVFRLGSRKTGAYIRDSIKDSAIVSMGRGWAWMLTRPSIGGAEASWRGIADVEDGVIEYETLEPVLLPEPWETKTGWSTNAARIGSGEYLVGWHGIGRDMIYRNGLAVVDGEGNLLALSDGYLLAPRTVQELSGERPGVIFGCGLVVAGDTVVWIGGVADTAIGVYVAELDRVMEHMRWLHG